MKSLYLIAVEYERWQPMNQVLFSMPDEIMLALKATPEALENWREYLSHISSAAWRNMA